MCPKGFVTAAFGSSGPFYFGKWACPSLSAPSLHRESTDSLINKMYPTLREGGREGGREEEGRKEGGREGGRVLHTRC